MEDKVALIELLNDVIFCWNLVKHNWFYTKFCVAHKFVAWYLNAALNSLQSKSLVWSKLMLVLTNLPFLGWMGRRLPANGALGSSEVPYIIYSLWSFQNKKKCEMSENGIKEWKTKNEIWKRDTHHPAQSENFSDCKTFVAIFECSESKQDETEKSLSTNCLKVIDIKPLYCSDWLTCISFANWSSSSGVI